MTGTLSNPGPYETSGDASLAARLPDGGFPASADLHGLLKDTMHAAGVDLGGWDWIVLRWLASLDAQTVAAVTGWVQRAATPDPGTTSSSAAPYETEQQVRELPAVRAVYAAFDRDPGPGKMTPHNHRMLCETLTAAGVDLGAYDHRIVSWLATWEPQTAAVVAGLITRASHGLTTADLDTIRRALDDAAAYQSERSEGVGCADCARLDPAQCEDHARNEELTAAYDVLAAKLAGA